MNVQELLQQTLIAYRQEISGLKIEHAVKIDELLETVPADRQQELAWQAVCAALDKVCPAWKMMDGATGEELAIAAIEKMGARIAVLNEELMTAKASQGGVHEWLQPAEEAQASTGVAGKVHLVTASEMLAIEAEFNSGRAEKADVSAVEHQDTNLTFLDVPLGRLYLNIKGQERKRINLGRIEIPETGEVLGCSPNETVLLIADEDGWYQWSGGVCPVPIGTRVDVKYKSKIHPIAVNVPAGQRTDGLCAEIWKHNGNEGDIIAFRLHKPKQGKDTLAGAEAELHKFVMYVDDGNGNQVNAWNPWLGGDCPVTDGLGAVVQYRTGINRVIRNAGDADWRHTGLGGDIVGFQIRDDIGVHESHCCSDHGCKYGDSDCPVAHYGLKQLYRCEECLEDTNDVQPLRDEGGSEIDSGSDIGIVSIGDFLSEAAGESPKSGEFIHNSGEAYDAVIEAIKTTGIELSEEAFLIDWSKAPDWANYHAVDSIGAGFWYSSRPIPNAIGGVWYYHQSVVGAMSGSGLDFGVRADWNASLRERPIAKPKQPVEIDNSQIVAKPIPTEGDVPVGGQFVRRDGTTWQRISESEVVKFVDGRPMGAKMPLFTEFPVGAILEKAPDLLFVANADVSEGGES